MMLLPFDHHPWNQSLAGHVPRLTFPLDTPGSGVCSTWMGLAFQGHRCPISRKASLTMQLPSWRSRHDWPVSSSINKSFVCVCVCVCVWAPRGSLAGMPASSSVLHIGPMSSGSAKSEQESG